MNTSVTDPTLVFAADGADGVELVVNFGVHAGREATPAEVERLADELLGVADALEIVCEHRYEIDRERRASVYQVRVDLPFAAAANRDAIAETVERWARDCIADRRLATP